MSVAGLLSLHTDQATSPANPFCLPNRMVVQFNTDQKNFHLFLRKLEKMSLSVKYTSKNIQQIDEKLTKIKLNFLAKLHLSLQKKLGKKFVS